MRYILFDLGDTLESGDVLLPGARQMLLDVGALRDDRGQAPRLGLLSDFDEAATPAEIPAIEARYRALIEQLGIADLFQPFAQAVTLSTQVGVFKPDRRIFRAALDKFDPDAHFHDAIFVTENPEHVKAARRLGMQAIHLKGPLQPRGDVDDLPGLVEPIARLLRSSSTST
jgi:FMN phosphatase YigB (HAD superfamily)